MQILFQQRLGRIAGWIFVIATCPLAALGIFMGRFLRWNSWDVLRHPRTLFADVLEQIQRPTSLDDEFAVVLILTPLLFLAYVSLLAFGKISESHSSSNVENAFENDSAPGRQPAVVLSSKSAKS